MPAIGVGFRQSNTAQLFEGWVAPTGVNELLRSSILEPVPPDALVLGFEPVALDYMAVYSWRYFGSEEVRTFMESCRPKLTATGLLDSSTAADDGARRMRDLILPEDYPWLPLMIFQPRRK
jgi:hypothetical protein